MAKNRAEMTKMVVVKDSLRIFENIFVAPFDTNAA